ncbi:LysE family translocator [Burkholderia stagnalis]
MLFVKSIVIGFSIAAPVGPIGMLCIQRSLARGFRAGFATGLGAACADAIYGLLGALGIAGLATAFPMLTTGLRIGGGAFLVWLAWGIARQEAVAAVARQERAGESAARDFLTTFGLTLSNPMTILSFVGIFAALGPPPAGAAEGAMWPAVAAMVAGVFAGSACWWLFLSGVTAALRTRMPVSVMHGLSRLSAAVLAVFGGIQVAVGVYGIV